jgi:hypothetical protein
VKNQFSTSLMKAESNVSNPIEFVEFAEEEEKEEDEM